MQGEDSKPGVGQLVLFHCPEKSPLPIGTFLDLLAGRTCYHPHLSQLSKIGPSMTAYIKVCFVQLVQHVMLCSHEFWSYSDLQ